MRSRMTTIVTGVVLVAVGASCAGGDDDGGIARPEPSDALHWEDCGDDVECASLAVPLDYAAESGATIALALERRRASGQRVGALVTNPGGPGASGLTMVENASGYFTPRLLERFDIVSWDPRGTGQSSPVDCADDLDAFVAVDRSPDDANEVDANIRAARALAAACERRSGDILPFLSTASTVRDLEAIRVALGESKLTYVGFSYGTYIGARYAASYPDSVRALVLDGAVDPALDFIETAVQQSVGFDASLASFFDFCDRRDCRFGGDDPRAAYTQLAARVDAEVLPATIEGEDRELGPGEFDIGVSTALYRGQDGYNALAGALRSAAAGDGTALLRLSDEYTGRRTGGEYSDELEAFYAIGCLDAPAPPIEELADVADRASSAAPNFGAATVWLSSPCSVWPVPPDSEPGPIEAAGAPPIVVIGTTGDPATPLAWARGLADGLASGSLLVYDGEGHTAYARGNACIDGTVDSYLIDLVMPADGKRC